MGYGYAIRFLRSLRGMNQSELAVAGGVSISHISLLERNQRDLKVSTMLKLCDALEISPVLFVFVACPGDMDHLGSEITEKMSAALLKPRRKQHECRNYELSV